MNDDKKKFFGYIYKFTNLITNKIYIGKRQSSTFDECYYGSGKKWRESLNGVDKKTSIKREVLQWCETKEELLQSEVFWIKQYNSQDGTIGYNIHKGGSGGNMINDHDKWSQMHRGQNNGRYGKEVTQETRNKIREANRGKIRSEETKQKISKALIGKSKPDGFSKKISLAQKGRKKSELELQHLREGNKKTAEKNTGKIIYTDGVKEIRLLPNEEIPAGFHRGRSTKGKSHFGTVLGKHWINNDVIEIYTDSVDLPEGFKFGRLNLVSKKYLKNRRNYSLGDNPRSTKVQCIETGKIYSCIKEAQLDTGLTTISACCRGLISECKKNHTHWRYINEN